MWTADAPANIALIKYMGKQSQQGNVADNPSLSYTLNQLRSTVVLEKSSHEHDHWKPLKNLQLSETSQQRFLNHLAYIKTLFDYQGSFLVRSDNNFPHSTGLASSASSFAALTLCAVQALSEITRQTLPDVVTQAQISRHGSGSSCRSFFSPWALWDGEDVHEEPIPYENLIHKVIIISSQAKDVSSSEAHRRVQTSPLYQGRGARARQNLNELLSALQRKNWSLAYSICWKEFQDMHALFSSAKEPFTYFNEASNKALDVLQNLWVTEKDGPIVTMDAGPNIHLLFRQDQAKLAQSIQEKHILGHDYVL